MYADDHQLYSAGQTVKEVQDTLNKEGEIICKWYESNLLKGNYKKYQIMSIGPKGKTKDLEIMSNVKIKCGSDLSLLGLTIDQNLDFSKLVSEVCKRAGRKVSVLTRLHYVLSARAKLITYKWWNRELTLPLLCRLSYEVRPRSSVGRVTVDLIRRSWVRFPPRSKEFFLYLAWFPDSLY